MTTARPASPGRRAVADLVDAACWLALPCAVVLATRGIDALAVRAVGVLVGAGAAGLVAGAVTGLDGRSPGRLLTRTRVVAWSGHEPASAVLGLVPGVRRSATKAAVGLGTFGLGWIRWAVLGLADPSGLRRTPLDARYGSAVVDTRRLPPLAAPAPPPRGLVNLTSRRLAVSATPVEVPGVPRPRGCTSEPPLSTRADGWRLTFDTGESVRLVGSALIGRDPAPVAGVRHLVALASDDRSLSRTHARVGPVADGGLVLLDDGSSNGTLVIRRGTVRTVEPGRAVSLAEGDRVSLGDRWMTVHRETGSGFAEPGGTLLGARPPSAAGRGMAAAGADPLSFPLADGEGHHPCTRRV